jgi:hypothetical protein
MATLQDPQLIKEVGGKGCEECIFWAEYGERSLTLNKFVGRWGRCSNKVQLDDINKRKLTSQLTSIERINTDVNRLALDAIILSTTPTFSCDNMRIPKVD